MRLRVPSVAVALVALGSALSVGAARAALPPPPDVSAIGADFRQADSATYYTIDVEPVGGRTVKVSWILAPPENDPHCDTFAQSKTDPAQAVWNHGDGDRCDHTKMGLRGHTGIVYADVTDGVYHCTARYRGTISGSGDEPKCVTLAHERALSATVEALTYERGVLRAPSAHDVDAALSLSQHWLDVAISKLSSFDGATASRAIAHLRRAKTHDRLATEIPSKRASELAKAVAEKEAALPFIRDLP